MSTSSMTGLTIYMRHTDTNGHRTVREHRVWDKDLFVNARTDEALQANRKVKQGEPAKARAEQITREQYLKERG